MRYRILTCSIGICFAVGLGISAGCDSSSSTNAGSGPTMEELAAQLRGEPAATAAPTQLAELTPETEAAERPETDVAQEDADRPIGKQASDRGPQATQGGYMGAVIGANRTMRQLADDLPWKKSVQLFEAEKGYKPRNTQEFIDRVRGEGTPLPDIDPGTAYYYVPTEGQFGELYQVPIGTKPDAVAPSGR